MFALFMGIGPMELIVIGLILLVLVSPLVVGIGLAIYFLSRRPNANLRPCPDCGRGLSPLAKTCPHCGRPLETEQ